MRVLLILLACVQSALPARECYVATIFNLKTADCNNGDHLTVPQNLETDIKVLILNDNKITRLPIDAFARYRSLQELYMARNGIEEIAPDAFRHVRNLQKLDMAGNRLKQVPSHPFQHIRHLRQLTLHSNPIKFLTSDTFHNLQRVEKLDFENCWLERVDSAAFRYLHNLTEINLVNNELNTLSSEMQRYLPRSLRIFRLYRNPWRCDCRLRWLRQWIFVTSVNWDFGTDTPACNSPQLIRGINWKELKPKQFACASEIIVGNSTSLQLEVGGNITIHCEVFGDPKPLVTWKKGKTVVDAQTNPAKYTVLTLENSHRIDSSLTLWDVMPSDAGDYKCIALNLAGRSEVTYKVWVMGEPPPTPSKDQEEESGMAMQAIVGTVVGAVLFIFLLLFFIAYGLRKRDQRNHAYKVREYKKPTKGKGGKDPSSLDEESELESIGNGKKKDNKIIVPPTTCTTELLNRDNQVKQEKVKENHNETTTQDIPPPKEYFTDTKPADVTPITDIYDNSDPSENQFKMKIFTTYDHDGAQPSSGNPQRPPNDGTGAKSPAGKAMCNDIREVTPDLLKNDKNPLPNHKPATSPVAPQCGHKRAEENPYAKPSELKAAAFPKIQSRSADDLLDQSMKDSDPSEGVNPSRNVCKSRAKEVAMPRAPILPTRTSTSANVSPDLPDPPTYAMCNRRDSSGDIGYCSPKPHIKNSQSMGGLSSQLSEDDMMVGDLSGSPAREAMANAQYGGLSDDGGRYRTLPSRPRGALHAAGNPKRLVTVRFPEDPTQPSSSTNTPRSPTYQPGSANTLRCASRQKPTNSAHSNNSPAKTAIPKYHPQIIRGTSAVASASKHQTLPSPGRQRAYAGDKGWTPPSSKVSSPCDSITSNASSRPPTDSPQRKPTRAFSTSLDDILSPPFGNIPEKPRTTQKSALNKVPKPGEKDEYGTAV